MGSFVLFWVRAETAIGELIPTKSSFAVPGGLTGLPCFWGEINTGNLTLQIRGVSNLRE
jgi:hypothetical protein